MTGGSAAADDILTAGIDLLGVPDAAKAVAALSAFLGELARWNGRFGFMKATAEDLVVRHVLDSLAAWPAIAALAGRGAILDIGSGAGFPGIPLAVALGGATVTLLERAEKKCAFLRSAAIILGLRNVEVLQADYRDIDRRADVVTFRAVSPLAPILRDLDASRVRFGALVAYKGRLDRITEELKGIGCDRRDVEVRRLSVPFLDEERHLVVVKGPRARGPAVS